eukprot:1141651-Pelagomonas_calceolata.AAC.4
MSELRQEGRCFSVYDMHLLPEAPLLVPGPQASNGIGGDHVDIELVISAKRSPYMWKSQSEQH